MQIDKIIELVGLVLGGGFIGGILTYKLGNKKVDNEKDSSDRNQIIEEFKLLLEQRKEITDKLIEENSKLVIKLQDRIDRLEKELLEVRQSEFKSKEEINTLRNQLLIFESSHVDIPLAMWMKDTEGKMIFINSIYEDIFLIPRGYKISDYLGKTDNAVWSREVSKAFAKNDAEVIRNKKYIRTIERVDDVNGDTYEIEILKYPRKINNKVIGISGVVLNYNLKNYKK